MDYTRIEYSQPAAGGVNVFRVGDTLVDTGHVARREPVARAVREGDLQGVERVVLTHPHVDHFGGSVTIPELADLPHVVYEGAETILNDVDTYLRDVRNEMAELSAGLSDDVAQQQAAFHDVFFPLEETYLDVSIERVVSDGDTVRLGDQECEVVHTPGHSAQHMSLLHRDTRTMLSGDIVSGNGHFMFAPLHWDVGDYKASLSRLQTLDTDLLAPGHGPELTEPDERIDDCIEKAERTEKLLREGVARRGQTTARELAAEVLDAGEAQLPFLTLVVAAYLHHLAETDTCTVTVDDDGVHVSARTRERH